MDNRVKEVKISVYCLAYNCAKYIEKSINGMLSQKINVDYKIIIHDDASNDGTADIIRTYANKYPEKICAILQTENQYSKGVNIYEKYIAPNIEGNYIAICEGDDYWIDENKLQLQYDYMEKHPDCSLCTHNTEKYDLATNKKRNFNNWHEIHILTEHEVFLQWSVHTSSYFIRKECKNWQGNRYWFGDYIMLTWAFYLGKVVCLPKIMSVYNFHNPNGVMKSIYNSQVKTVTEEMKKYLNEYNEKTKNKYNEIIQKKCQNMDYGCLVRTCDNIIMHSTSKTESIDAAKKIRSHRYYREYIKGKKGITHLMIKYRYEGYHFYPLWKFIMRKYLKTRWQL